MKRLMFAALIIALVLSMSVSALAVGVVCNGTICGGAGVRSYEYDLTGTGVTSFEIGWHCGTCLTNVLMPAGWSWAIVTQAAYKDDPFTQHGQLSPWTGYCPSLLRWSGPASDNPIFGYDSSCLPHDVGWSVSSLGGSNAESWGAPVGTGQGPVHAPIPEPASLLALGSGLVALAGTVLRRRS